MLFLRSLVMVLAMSSLCVAQQYGYSTRNVWGGYNYQDGSSTRPNVMGGVDIYDMQGSKVGSTRSNIFGGTDYFDSRGSNTLSTRSNVMGGYDYMNGGTKIATGRKNVFGGEDLYSNGNLLGSTRPNVHGGYDYNRQNIGIGTQSTWGRSFHSSPIQQPQIPPSFYQPIPNRRGNPW